MHAKLLKVDRRFPLAIFGSVAHSNPRYTPLNLAQRPALSGLGLSVLQDKQTAVKRFPDSNASCECVDDDGFCLNSKNPDPTLDAFEFLNHRQLPQSKRLVR